MIYVTGDTHGNFAEIERFTKINKTSKNDVMLILGDAGINYFLDGRDEITKKYLSTFPITFLCIHGNHEERAENVDGYKKTGINENGVAGNIYLQEMFPNIWFAVNGEISLERKRCFVVGGAYSVDKMYRLRNNLKWFKSEELTDKELCELKGSLTGKYDFILSHTCPEGLEPKDCYLPGVNQESVSKRTEKFLDEVRQMQPQAKWYCGHWHIDRVLPEITFMFHKIKKFGA